jgi:carbonic anhydrase
MRKTLSILSLAGLLAARLAAADPNPAAGVSPDDALRMLSAGNERFARNLVVRPHVDAERLRALAHQQQPFAAVVACSDSRVAPELLFDQGLGDLFVVREQGNIIKSEVEVGSLEYAVQHLGVNLVVVLGHSKCDAVKAAIAGVKKDDHSSMDELAADLKPAVDEARDKVGGLTGDDLQREATEKNVMFEIKQLLKLSPLIADKVAKGQVKVLGGVYQLENNRVQWLGEHPSEKAIIEGKKP